MQPNFSSSMAERAAGETSSEKEVKYKGVRKRKWGKWVSEIRLPNSRDRIWLGSYDTAEKAARAFDAALFCLRGRNSKFNFPDTPPPESILGGGRSLTPSEIQAVASQYANSYQQQEAQNTTAEVQELEDGSPSSTSDGVAPMDAIDWSFLDMLEPPHDHNSGPTATVSDYSLISGLDNLHEDMYMSPHLGARIDNNGGETNQEDENGDGNYSHQSFLWNF